MFKIRIIVLHVCKNNLFEKHIVERRNIFSDILPFERHLKSHKYPHIFTSLILRIQ